jgi:hypothetical protein
MVSSEGACAAHYTYGRFKDARIEGPKIEPVRIEAA